MTYLELILLAAVVGLGLAMAWYRQRYRDQQEYMGRMKVRNSALEAALEAARLRAVSGKRRHD